MIDALLIGRLYGKPVEKLSKAGKPYWNARVRVPTRDGEAQFVSVVAFSRTVGDALVALDDSDAVALSGELTLSGYLDKQGQPRPGADLLAHALLSEYSISRKRKAIARDDQPAETDSNGPMQASARRAPEFDDAIPF